MVTSLEESAYCAAFMETLMENYENGLVISTDFSGMGAPEMAMCSLTQALAGWGVDMPMVQFWRAVDKMDLARQVLTTHAGQGCPQHVFGDLLSQVSPNVAALMSEAQAEAESALNQMKHDSDESVAESERVQSIGNALVDRLSEILSTADFKTHSYCHRCRKQCPLEPEECRSRHEPPDLILESKREKGVLEDVFDVIQADLRV